MKTMLKAILIILGLAIIALFVFPIYRGVFNTGSIAGIALGVCIIFVTLFSDKLFASKAFVAIFSIIFVLVLFLSVSTSIFIFSGAAQEPLPDSVVIVLGCQVKGNKPSLMLERRIEAAAEYLKAHPDAICICSGGKGSDESISEAQCIYTGLTSRGIAEDRLYLEDKSTTTAENFRFSKKIIDEVAPGSSVAIVTNEFHQYRAGKICESVGLQYGSVPSKTSWWLRPTYHVREMFAVLNEWVGRPIKH